MPKPCPACHKPNANTARRCVHCGHEVKLTEERGDRTLRCPTCRVDIDEVRFASVLIDVCSRCAGLWLDRGEMTSLPAALSDAEMQDAARSVLDVLAALGSRSRKAAYLRCPVCIELMTRRTFVATSGVMLNQCEAHDTWLDREAGERLFGLLAAGRLEDLKARAAQNERDDVSRRLLSLESKQRAVRLRIEGVEQRQRWHVAFDVLDIL
jgi:Zn-finger nucleic acid-binding protein